MIVIMNCLMFIFTCSCCLRLSFSIFLPVCSFSRCIVFRPPNSIIELLLVVLKAMLFCLLIIRFHPKPSKVLLEVVIFDFINSLLYHWLTLWKCQLWRKYFFLHHDLCLDSFLCLLLDSEIDDSCMAIYYIQSLNWH